MRQLRQGFIEQVATWEPSVKIALAIATMLLFIALSLFTFGGDVLRQPSLVGIVTLMLMIQGIVLWGNRKMVTSYTQAQRYYLNGELDKARQILESQRESQQTTFNELTLLGNTYRQLGMLAESEIVLYEALNISPKHHFPLYGLGRTLLAKGDYPEAVEKIQFALKAGAPPIIRVDLVEALYRNDEPERACAVSDDVNIDLDETPYRVLMTAFIRYRLNVDPAPAQSIVELGLPYWEECAKRFAHTAYGQSLMQDVQQMRALIKGV